MDVRGHCELSVLILDSDSAFVGNAVGKGGSGGGLWVEGGATVEISGGTRFLSNFAASSYMHRGAGGAVAVSASSRLDMSDECVLEGNVAGPEVHSYVYVLQILSILKRSFAPGYMLGVCSTQEFPLVSCTTHMHRFSLYELPRTSGSCSQRACQAREGLFFRLDRGFLWRILF